MADFLLRIFVKDHGNTKDPTVRTATGSFAGWVGIIANLLLVTSKMLVGFISGSVSVIADGLNNLLDAGGSLISLLGFRLASKKADKEHPFGHGRYEYISGLAVAMLVLVVGLELGKSSIEKLFNPTPVNFGAVSLMVLGVSVLLKLWLASFNRNLSDRISSTSLKATSVDSFGDAISTGAVLLGAIITRLTGVNLDGIVALAVAAFIIYNGITLIKKTISPLLGEAPSQEMIDYLEGKISAYECVLDIHDLIIHDYGPERRFASVHVDLDSGISGLVAHEYIDGIEDDIWKEDNIHLVIHHVPVDSQET